MRQLFEGREAVRQAYRARPELGAIHYCLTLSSCLPEVTRSLVEQPVAQSPREQVSANDALIEASRAAGRSAYRAALILSEMKVPLH